MTRAAYIVSALRSPVGKAFKGSLAHKRPDELCAELIKGVLNRSGDFDPQLIEDVIVGCAMPEAEQGMNVARFALLMAGLPDSVPGKTVNRFCSSGIETIATAAAMVEAGRSECLLAGGTESMTMVPMMGNKVVCSREVMDSHPEYYLGMGLTAEKVSEQYSVSREDQDAFAYQSHKRATEAIEKGWFKDEILPIAVSRRVPDRSPDGAGQVSVTNDVFSQDEGPRPDTSLEALAKLRPAFNARGTVTAGNSSQMSDGAGMCLVVSEDFLKEHGLTPDARFVSYSVAGVKPEIMGIGPVAAIPKALEKGGKTIADIDQFELNEAFAAQSLAVMRTLELDPARVNPTGGAIALGHPLGATGAKLAATVIHGLKRTGGKYGMVTMCIGTGMGAAAVLEAL